MTLHEVLALSLATLLVSWLLCGLYLRIALRWEIVAEPNARSSHSRPTPHGGGVPALLAFTAAVLVATHLAPGFEPVYAIVLGITLLLMMLGVLDDIRGLPIRLRLVAYALGAAVAVVAIFPDAWPEVPSLRYIGLAVAIFAVLWMMNLFNFMDGIDGLAALQCVLACAAAALLSGWQQANWEYPAVCLLLAAAHLGFLVWNWPPASMFMGDAGSIPTGFLLAVLALQGALTGQLPLACWLILLAPFITDASYTLVWRMIGGQAFTQPHRLHAYQRLSRRWEGHLPVVLLLLAMEILWLIPLAMLSVRYAGYQQLLVILAYFPLLFGMVKAAKFA